MYLFYCPDIEKQQTLSEEESAHCVRVLRYSVGDEILKIGSSSVSTGPEIVYELFRAGNDADRRYLIKENREAMKVDLTVLRNGERILLHDVSFPVESESGYTFGLRDFYYDEHPKTFSSMESRT